MLVALVILALGHAGSDPTALSTPLPPQASTTSHPADRVPSAGPSSGLGPSELERIALRHNPTIGQAIERFEQARGRAMQAGAYPNPLVIWSANSLGNEGTAGTQQGLFQQPIVTGGKLRVNRSRYEVDVEIARWNYLMQRMRVSNGVRLRHLQILAQQQLLDLRSSLTRLSEEVVRATRAKFESDHASEPDLLMAENEAAQLRLDLDQLRERHLNTWREFAAYLGCPYMPPPGWPAAWRATRRRSRGSRPSPACSERARRSRSPSCRSGASSSR